MITNNVDCTDKGNVAQAKHELHRAVETRDSAARTILLGDWSVKWGEALIEVATDHIPMHERLETDLDNAHDEVEALQNENSDLEDQIDDLEAEIKRLKSEIEGLKSK